VRCDDSTIGQGILVHFYHAGGSFEQRDRKGLYAQARAGILKELLEYRPYEETDDAE